MNNQEIAARYLQAWNDQNLEALVELMHPGAAYYDAFWMETYVGSALREAILDAFEDEPFYYELVDDIVDIESGVVFRLRAYDRADTERNKVMYEGADVLIIRDGKIMTVTAHWVSPYRVDLKEVGEIALKRHGVTVHG